MHQRCILQRLAFKSEYNLHCGISDLSRSRGHVPTRTHTVLASKSRPDPFTLVSPLLNSLRTSLFTMLGSGHPAITEITKYYFLHPSKQVRPVIVLLFSQATNGLCANWPRKLWESQYPGAGGRTEELNQPLTRPDVLNDWNPQMPDDTRNFESVFGLNSGVPHRQPVPAPPKLTSENATALSPQFPPLNLTNTLLPTQLRLAQIVELLHTASLLHDDVIDASALRRGAPSAPAAFGNKLSILGGNFVLGRASAALARLGDGEVTELIASVISNLVEGEILQMKEVKMEGNGEGKRINDDEPAQKTCAPGKTDTGSRGAWNIYLQKTYLKTASLMAKGARSAVVLGGCKEGEVWKEIAYAYGRNLGIAFQVCSFLFSFFLFLFFSFFFFFLAISLISLFPHLTAG